MTAAAGGAMAAPGAADATFKALYEKEWAWRQAELARSDGPEDDTLAPHLPYVDAASQAKRLAYWQDVRKKLDAIRLADLSPEQRVNYQVYRDQIDVLVNQQRFREYEKPFNSDSSFWSNFNYKARRTF